MPPPASSRLWSWTYGRTTRRRSWHTSRGASWSTSPSRWWPRTKTCPLALSATPATSPSRTTSTTSCTRHDTPWNTIAGSSRTGSEALGRVWRFHVGAPLPADDRLLLELGVEPPARRRVHRDHIGTALKGCNAIHNMAVTWVTCDGADDVCHLMSCFDDPEIVRQVSSRMNFVRNSRSFFPQLYDLRFLAEWRTLAGEEPPLAAAARAGGPAALLRGFLALMKEPTFAEQMEGYNGILFGIGHLDTPDVVNRHKMSREERQRRYRMEFCRKRC
uniref:Uncharacterized protein n=1 Tax=Avena sativa TaxID=4498 RepID=A0ACD5TZS9_AVESA